MSTVASTTATGSVAAILPLLLLESVHAHDRPDEILEDEDLTVSLPRRLGLTGVIDTQKRRYESAAKSGKKVPLEEFVNLTRLVLKRPDADAIMRDTGHRMANHFFSRVPAGYIKLLRVLPRSVLVSRWRKAVRRLLKQMGGEVAEASGRPVMVRLSPVQVATLEPTSRACVVYAASVEQLGELYTNTRPIVTKTRCVGYGDSVCEWRVDQL